MDVLRMANKEQCVKYFKIYPTNNQWPITSCGACRVSKIEGIEYFQSYRWCLYTIHGPCGSQD